MSKIYIGDIGTRLRTTLNTDITGYSSIIYKIKKPSGTVMTKSCIPENEVNGIIYYDTIINDLDEIGTYLIQTDVKFSNGNKNLSLTKSFIVYNEFK